MPAGTYIIAIRNDNGSGGYALATHLLSINNGIQIAIPIVNSGWDKWGVTIIRANLTLGFNTLTFMKGSYHAEIDVIDFFLDI